MFDTCTESRCQGAEFRKLLDHPGVFQNSVLGVLSRLQLARAEAMTGDLEDARKHYREFLDAWKDADPDVPVLKEAKKEYARLQVATAARDD